MKTVKILGAVFILLAALVVGLIVYVFGNINQIVKEVVETVGPQVTKTHVGLRDVDITLTKGRGELNHFVIGNPDGFSSPYFLKWDAIAVEIDPASVQSDVIVINDMVIKGVKINAEQKGTSTNIQALLDNIPSDKSETQPTTAESGETEDIKLALSHIVFAENDVELITEKWGSYTLSMPSFELNGLGDKDNGLTPEELGKAILKPVLKQIKDQMEDKLKDITKEKLKAKLEEKKEEIKAKVDEKKQEFKDDLEKKKETLDDKADVKKEELKEKLEKEKAALDEKKEEFNDKVDDKLKSLFK
ncbi:MAG: AsmA family protein [Agarilytica sp.]